MKSGIFNRQSILEVSLLAIFALGLFVSKIIVDYKNRIILGPEIQLASSGLTVHLPVQSGWRGLKQWQYERDNSFVLPAGLMGRTGTVIDVLWKYTLTWTSQNSRQVLQELTEEAGGMAVSEIQSTGGNCPMEYVVIPVSPNEEQYIGVVMLDFGRMLVLQAKGQLNNPVSVQDVFLSLAHSLDYDKPDELVQGVEFLEKARIFATDLFSAIPSKHYLIRDASGNIGGYETLSTRMNSQQLHISKLTSLPMGVVGQREHQFESTNPLEKFTWVCHNSANTRPLGAFCLELKEDGSIIVENTSGQTRSASPGPAIVSEILLDWLIRYFLETEQQKIALDILYFDGQIIPAQIFLLSPAQAMGKTQTLAFAVRVESLGGSVWEYYFDADKQLLGKITLEAHHKILLWDCVQAGEIETYIKSRPAHKEPAAQKETENENTNLDVIKENQI